MRRNLVRLIALVPSLLAAQAFAQIGDIVDTAYVRAALARGAIVWDVRDADSYRAGHIPGAVSIGNAGSVLRDPNREDWIGTPQVEKILGDAGLDIIGREVIAYSTTGDPYAYFGLHTIRYFGGRQGKVYHGGIDAWKAAGNAVATEPSKLAPVALKLAPDNAVVVWNDDVVSRVRAGGTQFVDVRTPKEYAGDDVRAIRGGHIPGAVNVPYEQNWIDPATPGKLASRAVATRDGMALKPVADLRKLYANLDPDKETIVYCQSGVRGAQTATVLRGLGFKDVKVYEPSWLGYAGMLSAPADNQTFVNVGALNGRIAALQDRVDDLEQQVAALRKPRKR